jgi:hypothetical protein
VDELVSPNRDAHVRRSIRDRPEEDQVAGLDARQPHLGTKLKLLTYFARQRHAVLREDVLHEPAAVETGGIAPAVPVGDAPKAQRGFRDRAGIDA